MSDVVRKDGPVVAVTNDMLAAWGGWPLKHSDRNPFPPIDVFPRAASAARRVHRAVTEARWRVECAVDVLRRGDDAVDDWAA